MAGSAPLGPAAAPPRPGVGCEGSAPLARPWAHVGVRGPRGRPPRAREGRPPSLYPLIHVASFFFGRRASPARAGHERCGARALPGLHQTLQSDAPHLLKINTRLPAQR